MSAVEGGGAGAGGGGGILSLTAQRHLEVLQVSTTANGEGGGKASG